MVIFVPLIPAQVTLILTSDRTAKRIKNCQTLYNVTILYYTLHIFASQFQYVNKQSVCFKLL